MIGLIIFELMYSLCADIMPIQATLDAMNLYKIIFNVIVIGLQK